MIFLYVNRRIRPVVVSEYAQWLGLAPWQLFCTLTFAYQVSEQQANAVFAEFVARAERSLRSPLTYVRGDEFRFSGCGMPGSPRHFHLVLASAAQLEGEWLAAMWEGMAGIRTNGAGADVRRYDPTLDGISYVLKFIGQNGGDWSFGNLDLVLRSPSKTPRERRRQRRHDARILAIAGVSSAGPRPAMRALIAPLRDRID